NMQRGKQCLFLKLVLGRVWEVPRIVSETRKFPLRLGIFENRNIVHKYKNFYKNNTFSPSPETVPRQSQDQNETQQGIFIDDKHTNLGIFGKFPGPTQDSSETGVGTKD